LQTRHAASTSRFQAGIVPSDVRRHSREWLAPLPTTCATLQLPPDRSRQQPVLLRALACSLDPVRWLENASRLRVEKNGTYRVWDQRPASNSFRSAARKTLASDPGILLGYIRDFLQMYKPGANIFDRGPLMPAVNQPWDRLRRLGR